MKMKNVFATLGGIMAVGALIGVLAPLLQKLGNPGNMGICVACFERDIAGALGLHRAEVVQYMRPEIIGFVLGSLVAALLFKEFRPRAVLSGHIHEDRGIVMEGGTLFLNPGAAKDGNAALLDIDGEVRAVLLEAPDAA